MRIRIVKVGRIAYPELRSLAQMYEQRLGPLAKVEALELRDEAALFKLIPKAAADHPLIALDEHGTMWSSKELAAEVQKRLDDPGIKSLTFLIGGPAGLSPQARALAKTTWSLSRATFTSDLAWLLLWEQIYRAFSILKGTGYHHDGAGRGE